MGAETISVKGPGIVPELCRFDTDPDPALFFGGFHDATKNKFFCLLLYCKYIYVSLKLKQVIRKSQNCTNQGLSNFFAT
jgi:hypothetical protein